MVRKIRNAIRTISTPKNVPVWLVFIYIVYCLVSCVTHETKREEDLATLGHHLFFDNRLSYNKTRSCATCHDPKFAFTDGYRINTTASGDRLLHNTPSLINAADYHYFDWADSNVTTLIKQSDRPFREMGFTNEVLKRFNNDISVSKIKEALSAYVNTLRSRSSPYDKYINGDTAALSLSEKKGMSLFFSSTLKCATCHRPPLFTTASITTATDSIYFNTGLNKDDGKFKTPTLRNIALTAPYAHDGSVNDLREMIDIYANGGRGDGKFNPNKNKNITGFSLTAPEKKQLIDFLFALTDSSVLNNPKFQNPSHTTND